MVMIFVVPKWLHRNLQTTANFGPKKNEDFFVHRRNLRSDGSVSLRQYIQRGFRLWRQVSAFCEYLWRNNYRLSLVELRCSDRWRQKWNSVLIGTYRKRIISSIHDKFKIKISSYLFLVTKTNLLPMRFFDKISSFLFTPCPLCLLAIIYCF